MKKFHQNFLMHFLFLGDLEQHQFLINLLLNNFYQLNLQKFYSDIILTFFCLSINQKDQLRLSKFFSLNY